MLNRVIRLFGARYVAQIGANPLRSLVTFTASNNDIDYDPKDVCPEAYELLGIDPMTELPLNGVSAASVPMPRHIKERIYVESEESLDEIIKQFSHRDVVTCYSWPVGVKEPDFPYVHWYDVVIKSIRSAQREIRICVARFTESSIIQELQNKLNQWGKTEISKDVRYKLEIFVSFANAAWLQPIVSFHDSNKAALEERTDITIDLYFVCGAGSSDMRFMHVNGVTVDGLYGINGSPDWSDAAINVHFEMVTFFVNGHPAIEDINQFMNRLISLYQSEKPKLKNIKKNLKLLDEGKKVPASQPDSPIVQREDRNDIGGE